MAHQIQVRPEKSAEIGEQSTADRPSEYALRPDRKMFQESGPELCDL